MSWAAAVTRVWVRTQNLETKSAGQGTENACVVVQHTDKMMGKAACFQRLSRQPSRSAARLAELATADSLCLKALDSVWLEVNRPRSGNSAIASRMMSLSFMLGDHRAVLALVDAPPVCPLPTVWPAPTQESCCSFLSQNAAGKDGCEQMMGTLHLAEKIELPARCDQKLPIIQTDKMSHSRPAIPRRESPSVLFRMFARMCDRC